MTVYNADRLVRCRDKTIVDVCNKLIARYNSSVKPDDRWLLILTIVFAERSRFGSWEDVRMFARDAADVPYVIWMSYQWTSTSTGPFWMKRELRGAEDAEEAICK